MQAETFERDLKAVLKRHGNLTDEEIDAEAREIAGVFAKAACDWVKEARHDDGRLLGALIDIAKNTRAATRIQVALTAGITLYVIAWTAVVTATHML